MFIKKMLEIVLTHDELKEAILNKLEGELNELVADTPEWKRRHNIIWFIKNSNQLVMDWQKNGDFVISTDGIFETEEF